MKYQKIVFLFVFTLLISCKKYTTLINGQIVGWNQGFCPTCGGFYINLSNDTAINANTLYALNYTDNVRVIVNQYYTAYSKNHVPIPISFSSQAIPNENNWIKVTSLVQR